MIRTILLKIIYVLLVASLIVTTSISIRESSMIGYLFSILLFIPTAELWLKLVRIPDREIG